MNDAGGVGVGERGAELGADVGDLAVGDLAGGGQLAQVRALDQLADQIGAAVVLAELVEGDDSGVVEPRGGVGLAQHPPGGVVGDGFDGDPAAEPLVPGTMDGAVATVADALADGESPKYELAFDHERDFAAPAQSPCVDRRPVAGLPRGADAKRSIPAEVICPQQG